jgi:hypothetical protein
VSEVSHILDRGQAGEARAAEEFLPLVYEELRKVSAADSDGVVTLWKTAEAVHP